MPDGCIMSMHWLSMVRPTDASVRGVSVHECTETDMVLLLSDEGMWSAHMCAVALASCGISVLLSLLLREVSDGMLLWLLLLLVLLLLLTLLGLQQLSLLELLLLLLLQTTLPLAAAASLAWRRAAEARMRGWASHLSMRARACGCPCSLQAPCAERRYARRHTRRSHSA